jgi:hypothetical protein
MRSIAICAAIALSFLFLTTAKAGAQAIALNGPWKFHTGDDLQWANPNFNDSRWETVDLTPPPGAHDGDVGLSGYVTGWTAKGHPNYWGYAWYRIKIKISGNNRSLMLAGPPLVDDAYEVYADGTLIGRDGNFSYNPPVVYSIMPKLFPIPKSVHDSVTIAFRVWADPSTVAASPDDAGGIHIAPKIGNEVAIHKIYNHEWKQTFYGYVVDFVEPLLFVVLTLMIFAKKELRTATKGKWLIIALIITALVRVNQVTFYWFQFESNHDYDIAREVLLTPLCLMAWLLTWREWFNTREFTRWLPKLVWAVTGALMLCRLFSLLWVMPAAHHDLCATFGAICNWLRLLFLLLYLYIVFAAIRYKQYPIWYLIVLYLLIGTGLFAAELSAIHIPGIWFPFGVGVSRTQYAYALFIIILFVYIKSLLFKNNINKA